MIYRKLKIDWSDEEAVKKRAKEYSRDWRAKHKNDTPEEVEARKLYWKTKHEIIKRLKESENKFKGQ